MSGCICVVSPTIFHLNCVWCVLRHGCERLKLDQTTQNPVCMIVYRKPTKPCELRLFWQVSIQSYPNPLSSTLRLTWEQTNIVRSLSLMRDSIDHNQSQSYGASYPLWLKCISLPLSLFWLEGRIDWISNHWHRVKCNSTLPVERQNHGWEGERKLAYRLLIRERLV